MTEQNMAGRLAKIMGDVGRVEKKGRIVSKGDGPNYKFAKDSDVLEAVGPPLAEAGIVMVPEHTDLLSIEPNMRGTQLIANIKTSWHVTDGKESLRFETLGQGQDSGDKALPKAQSNARKYAFFMLFHIVTGDDPDHYASTEQPERSRGPARAASTPSGSAPAGSQYRREELASLMAEKSLDLKSIEIYANLVGIPKGERATNEQMDALIDAVRGHGIEEAIEPAVAPAVSESGSAPQSPTAGTAGDVPPSPAVPPKPETDEFKALPPVERATARVFWQTHAEEPAEQMRAALTGGGA